MQMGFLHVKTSLPTLESGKRRMTLAARVQIQGMEKGQLSVAYLRAMKRRKNAGQTD
jgi:hypothetical protein